MASAFNMGKSDEALSLDASLGGRLWYRQSIHSENKIPKTRHNTTVMNIIITTIRFSTKGVGTFSGFRSGPNGDSGVVFGVCDTVGGFVIGLSVDVVVVLVVVLVVVVVDDVVGALHGVLVVVVVVVLVVVFVVVDGVVDGNVDGVEGGEVSSMVKSSVVLVDVGFSVGIVISGMVGGCWRFSSPDPNS